MRDALGGWRERLAAGATTLREERARRAGPRPPGHPVARLGAAALLVALALALILSTAGLDSYLHRGAVFGLPAAGAAPATGAPLLGMNVFLEKEVDRENIATTIRMLREANVTFVRQTFSWAEIESQPGQYRDVNSGRDSFEKYDFIVDQLHGAGIGILARVDTIPRWARRPGDDLERWDKGPPRDFDNYADFVAVLAARYRGKIAHFQVWNEPNLEGEWGGGPIDPALYGRLLQATYPKVKAANPEALIVTAGLAQTDQDGVTTNNMNELRFIQGLYDAGARDSFDILSVMAYGIGASPEDRRVDPLRINFSRIVQTRELMVRNGDAAKPVWVSEYGWVALPDDWPGDRVTVFGPSVDEETQARYLIDGLDRMRREWPWIGAVFVWGFRWVERPEDRPGDVVPHFAVVGHDFTPRPAYLALRRWSGKQAVATAGPLATGDARLDWQGPWRVQRLAGGDYRVAESGEARARLAFDGTALQLRARVGPRAGRVYVAIDGRPVPGLSADERGSYIGLRATEVAEEEFAIAGDLADGEHLLELRGSDGGEVAIAGLTIGRRQPFAWAAPTLFVAGLAGLFAGLVLGLRTLARLAGWLPAPRAAAPPRPRLAWWDTHE